MEMKYRQVHFLGPRAAVELGEHARNLVNLLGIQAAPVVVLE
jgi:hypothetical protein